jgi:hypothetical protein
MVAKGLSRSNTTAVESCRTYIYIARLVVILCQCCKVCRYFAIKSLILEVTSDKPVANAGFDHNKLSRGEKPVQTAGVVSRAGSKRKSIEKGLSSLLNPFF